MYIMTDDDINKILKNIGLSNEEQYKRHTNVLFLLKFKIWFINIKDSSAQDRIISLIDEWRTQGNNSQFNLHELSNYKSRSSLLDNDF